MIKNKRFVHGGNVYEPSAAGSDGGKWLDFSANINPLGLSASVKDAIAAHVGGLVHYPDPEARELRAALAGAYETPEDTFVLGNGAAELFYLFFEVERPKRVLLPVPSFSEYERAALASGADVEYFLLREKSGFAIDCDALLDDVRETKTEAVVLGNPNNPTGTLLSREELVRLSERLIALGCSLVVDESFLDFRRDEAAHTIRREAGRLPHCLLVRSLTKFYAMPGLRLGFGVCMPALATKLDAHEGRDETAQVGTTSGTSDDDVGLDAILVERPLGFQSDDGLVKQHLVEHGAQHIAVALLAEGTLHGFRDGATQAALRVRVLTENLAPHLCRHAG